MECELCGRANASTKAEVEGTLLTVCNSCAHLGRRIESPVVELKDKKPLGIRTSDINPNFAQLVKNTRKKLNINLEELGKKINEKSSVLERVEKGMRPTDSLAGKLEKALKIKLLGYEEE